MSEFINSMKNLVLSGEKISKTDALKLVNEPNLDEFLRAANEIRQRFCGDKFDLCTIINVKSGRCSENCAYCAQSAHFKTGCEVYGLKDKSEVLEMAKTHENEATHRFSLVASGKGLKENDKDMDKIEQIYQALTQETGLHLCASFGIADKKALEKLKNSGVKTYHHNLETSRRFYPQICTTHTYDDRISTIKNAIEIGLDVCSGGIFGMGENMQDRIDMAHDLLNLGVTSVPINILTPIPGTPLEHNAPLDHSEILRTIAIYRFILPDVYLRFAGGRNNLGENVKNALHSGINSALTGNFLTTTGDSIKSDKMLFVECGFDVEKILEKKARFAQI